MKKIKELFATPKKAAISCAVLAGCLLVLGTGSVFAASTIAETNSIGVAAAQNFAFADAGIDPASAYVDHTDFDFERGQFIYEVEFIANGTEYEYWVKASDGTVVKKETKVLSANGSNVATPDQISQEEAKEAALSDAGLTAADVTFTKEKLDYDDGMALYDVEFYTDAAKYEYEINATTGAVFSRSKETFAAGTQAANPTQNNAAGKDTVTTSGSGSTGTSNTAGTNSANTAGTGDAGLEAAKAAALADAGYTADQVYLTKCEPDYDDGVLVYDIDFCVNGYEHDYEIHGSTCAVLSKSVEHCDHDDHPYCDNNGICDGTGSGYGYGDGTGTGTGNGNGAAGTSVDLEQAKSIAVSHAGLTVDQVTFSKAKLDHDDGLAVYEIEFYYDGSEHECKVDCATGAIVDYECESEHHHR